MDQALQEEVALLREENRQLREALAPPDAVTCLAEKFGLQANEAIILHALLTRMFVSREQLMSRVYWGDKEVPASNNLAVYISRLRRKVGAEIKSIRGLGYSIPEGDRSSIKQMCCVR